MSSWEYAMFGGWNGMMRSNAAGDFLFLSAFHELNQSKNDSMAII